MEKQTLVHGVEIDTSKENPIIIQQDEIEQLIEWRHTIKEHCNVYVQISCKHCGKIVIKNVVRTKEKYCSVKFLSFCRACSQRNSNMEKYGVENIFQLEITKQKAKNTCHEKYGADCFKQSDIGKESFKQYSMNRYGTENPFQAEEVKQKSKETLLHKYGVDHPLKSQDIKENQKRTFMERYNVSYALQNPSFLEKAQHTMLIKYGVNNSMYLEAFKNKCLLSGSSSFCKSSYIYDNIKFDSSWELYFYIYYKTLGKDIIRNSSKFLTYFDNNNNQHLYIPDFIMDNQFFEVKGEQFIVRDSNNNICNLKNPYNENLNHISESKFQCMIQNNVNIITKFEIQEIIDFVIKKYGVGYVNYFKSMQKEN